MTLTIEQLNQIFNRQLKDYALARSINALPLFSTPKGGAALTKRVQKILREPSISYLIRGDKLDGQQAAKLLYQYLDKHKKIYIVGLNYWFTEKDVDMLVDIYNDIFNK